MSNVAAHCDLASVSRAPLTPPAAAPRAPQADKPSVASDRLAALEKTVAELSEQVQLLRSQIEGGEDGTA